MALNADFDAELAHREAFKAWKRARIRELQVQIKLLEEMREEPRRDVLASPLLNRVHHREDVW